MVALDGYRLAIRSEKLLKESTSASIVIPGRSLIEIAKLFEESDASASILIGDNLAIVDIGMSRIITRLLDGEYIKYKQVLPAEKATRVRVQSEELRSSVERASLLAREGRNNLIKIHIGDDKLTISANSEIGSVIEEVDVYMEGKELDIAFNARYLADVLKVINDEEILLDFNSSLSPCVVRPVSGDSFLYLIQPVRIYM
jgi:DNA polymerase-3 subunit beta